MQGPILIAHKSRTDRLMVAFLKESSIHTFLRPLTFTRFLAASLVVIFHYGKGAQPFREFTWIPELGSMMVSYFFTLSGFILASVYIHAAESGTVDYRQFWRARAARIMPVYLLAVALVWLISPVSFPDVLSLLLNFLLLQSWFPGYPITGNAPGWSLSVEALFYLLFPTLLTFMIRIRLRFAICLALLLWTVSQVIHLGILNYFYGGFPSFGHDFAYYFPLLHLNEFVLGIIGALAYQQGFGFQKPYHAVAVFFFTISLLVLTAYGHEALSAAIDFTVSFTGGLLAPIFLLLILSLCSPLSYFKALGNPLLVRLGEASYALYLLQIPLDVIYKMQIAPVIGIRPSLNFWLYYLLLVVVSLSVYRYFEGPLRKLLRNKSRKS